MEKFTNLKDEKTIEVFTPRDSNELTLFDVPEFKKNTLQYDYVKHEQGVYIIRKDECNRFVFGVIDEQVKEILPCEFEEIIVTPKLFLATKNKVGKIYYRDGSLLDKTKDCRCFKYFPFTNMVVLEKRIAEQNLYALYDLLKNDFICDWTNNWRLMGKFFVIKDEKWGNYFMVGEFGASKVRYVEHFKQSVLVQTDAKHFALYNWEGEKIWEDVK